MEQHHVTVSSASNDQDLSYDSTSSKWVNKTHRVELTKAEYDALPSSKLTDGIEYFITDMETTGTEIVANPEDTATDTLTKLQIGDEVYNISGGSGGGHTILDNDGTALTQRDELQFIGAYVNDDNTNEITKVNVVREMTKAQFDLLSNDEKVGLIRVTDEDDGIGSGFIKEILYTGTTFPSSTIQLSKEINDYDFIGFDVGQNTEHSNWFFTPTQLKDSNHCIVFSSGGFCVVYSNANGDEISFGGTQSWTNRQLYEIYGLKFGGGNSSSPLDYSTNEQKTGQKWIDGKDIYQKTFISDGGTSHTETISTNLSNVSRIIKIEGMVTRPDEKIYSLPAYNHEAVGYGCAVNIKSDFSEIYLQSNNWNPTDIIVTLYYTKTT